MSHLPLPSEPMTIVTQSIGWVRNEIEEPMSYGWEDVVSEIVLNEDLAEALDGIEGFSHLTVLCWLHRVPPDKRAITKLHPRDRDDLPLVGVLATHTQYRPNPIGVQVVRLLKREGNVLRVKGLDAIHGTPVLDLKPYIPHYDAIPDAKLPDWVTRLH